MPAEFRWTRNDLRAMGCSVNRAGSPLLHRIELIDSCDWTSAPQRGISLPAPGMHTERMARQRGSTQEVRIVVDGAAIVDCLRRLGIDHVIWLPDSEIGRWDAALSAAADIRLIRVCREG